MRWIASDTHMCAWISSSIVYNIMHQITGTYNAMAVILRQTRFETMVRHLFLIVTH